MRTSGVTTVWLVSLLIGLLGLTACSGSVDRFYSLIEDDTASTTSSADEADVTEIPEIQLDGDKGTTVPPSLEGDTTSSATEQDVPVTDQTATLDASLDAAIRTTLGAVDQKEGDKLASLAALKSDNKLASPAALRSDEVSYSGWTVLKVGGIKSSSGADETVKDPVEREFFSTVDTILEIPDSEYPLLDLEEHPGVRVLQENRLEGFYELAVSPSDLESVVDDLTARGFQVEDRKVDLGAMMTQDTIFSLRKNLQKGEATFDSYMTYEEIEDFILAFTEQNPQTVSREVIGKTVEGRDIHMLTLSMGGRQCRSLGEESSSSEEGSWRESRQIRRKPEGSTHPAVQQALEALTNIIRWGDLRDREADRKKASMENQQQGADETLQEEEAGSSGVKPADPAPTLEPEAITATHMLLEKIMQNIPYDYQIDSAPEANRTGKDTITNTFEALQEIMSNDKDQSDDYVYLDSSNQPEAVQLTYKVLQRIINYDPNNRKRETYKNSAFREVQNRLSKSLKLEDVNSTESVSTNVNKTSTDASDIEADILFLLSTFLPKEYAKNATIVESVKESLIIISKLLPEDGNLTQEVIDKLAPQIVDLPGVVGVSSSSDGSNSRNDLVIRLAHLIRSRDDRNKISAAEIRKVKKEPVQRMSGCKPIIFLDGGIHAREWISPAFMMYTLTQLVKNTPLILGAEWRVVPVLNPDGYVHTWTKDRLWRKNKAKNLVGCPGVDLNRNFGYHFGGAGTSTFTCSEIYRGTAAFSEPESQALKAAVEAVKDRVKAYATVHSYGQMILHPWGYSKSVHPNDEQLKSMGSGMASAIEQVYGTSYVVGSAARILYSAAGGSDDYMASIGIPYSFTLELRDEGRNGFILPAAEIKPTVVETWAAIEYLGNRIINENPRSASPATVLSADQAALSSLFNPIGHTATLPVPVGVYPFAPLVPLTSEFGAIPSFSGQGRPMFYSAGERPSEPATNTPIRDESPSATSNPSQFAPTFGIPQSLQYYYQGNQPLQAYYPFVVAPQGQATQAIQAPVEKIPTFSESLPNVSILENQPANVQLTPFASVAQNTPYENAFAQKHVSGNAPLLPLYPNAFYAHQTSSSASPNSFAIPADNVRDGQIVDYLSQVLSSLYRNEAASSSAGSNFPSVPQGTFENYEGSYPVPIIVQNPYWNVPMPASTPLRQSVYSGDSSSNPSFDGNSNVFIPYNSPMVVRPTTDFSENPPFPFPRQQFQNPGQTFQNFPPSTLEEFLNPVQDGNSFSSLAGFSSAPQISQFRPSFPSPARPNFKTDIDQVFRQDPNEHIEEQRLRHRFNAEYHRDSPVLVSLGNPHSEQSPSYSNRFDLPEGEIGELAHMISYPRSLGRQQEGHHQGFEVHPDYRQ